MEPMMGASQMNATHRTAARESRLYKIADPLVTMEMKSVRSTTTGGHVWYNF